MDGSLFTFSTTGWTVTGSTATRTSPSTPASVRLPPSHTRIEQGDYLPAALGLDLPELAMIHVGRCGSSRPGWLLLDWLLDRRPRPFEHAERDGVYAHAHYNGHVCIRDGEHVLGGPAEPHLILWHEYAHVVAGVADDHGVKWQEKMRELGQVPARYVNR